MVPGKSRYPRTDPILIILLDIDHSPQHWLHPENADFYTPEGLAALLPHLTADGIFALWADGQPDPAFVTTLETAFTRAEGHPIPFPNPLTGGESGGTVYLAER